jgi:hypothetical protein
MAAKMKTPKAKIPKATKPPKTVIPQVEAKAAKGAGRIGNLGDFAHLPKGRHRRT